MKLKPLQDWAVVAPAEVERTAGGLFIPDTAKEKPEEGIVEAIGPGAYEEEKRGRKKEEKKERKFFPAVVKPGDRVLFERWAGQTYTIGNEEKILVRERNILGLLERPAELPAVTSSSSPTAIAERAVPAPPMKTEAKPATPVSEGKKPAKAAAKKAVKKAAPKAAKTGAKPKSSKTGKKK